MPLGFIGFGNHGRPHKRARLEADAFGDADFPLQWMRKDLQVAAQTAYERRGYANGQHGQGIYALAIRYGLGDEDFSAIYRFLNMTARS